MVINDWKACYFFFIAVVFYRLLFSIQLKLCERARLSGVCFSHLVVTNRRPTLEHNFSDHSVCLHSYCSHFIDRDICLAEWIFNTLWLYWKQQQQKHSFLFLLLAAQFFFLQFSIDFHYTCLCALSMSCVRFTSLFGDVLPNETIRFEPIQHSLSESMKWIHRLPLPTKSVRQTLDSSIFN